MSAQFICSDLASISEHPSDGRDDDDKEVVLAVNNNGSALEYASKRLKDDTDVVLAATKGNGPKEEGKTKLPIC